MKKYLEVIADENDADYLTRRTLVTEDDIEELLPIIQEIKNKKGKWKLDYEDLYKLYDNLSHEQLNLFEDYINEGECGVHTIDSITILTVINEEKLL